MPRKRKKSVKRNCGKKNCDCRFIGIEHATPEEIEGATLATNGPLTLSFKYEPIKAITTMKFDEEPNPRKRPDKIDDELFAEWEEKTEKLRTLNYKHFLGIDYEQLLKDEISAIERELGPKLLEMRVAKVEERVRKLEEPFTRLHLHELMYGKAKPWWKFWA